MSKISLIILVIFVGVGGFFLGNRFQIKELLHNDKVPTENKSPNENIANSKNTDNSFQKYKFNNFYGQDLGTGGFEFEYPTNWKNYGQYFSPQQIRHYDINSVDAPVYYDLISEKIIDTSDLIYQIQHDKRYSKDSQETIDGLVFKKYDLLDYQSSEQNRVIIYVGPKIDILGDRYYLVFHFEEKPLGLAVTGNDTRVFEQMVKSLKFSK